MKTFIYSHYFFKSVFNKKSKEEYLDFVLKNKNKSIDEFEELEKEFFKRNKFKNFLKNKFDQTKNFFKQKYDSLTDHLKSTKEITKQYATKPISIGLIASILAMNGVEYSKNNFAQKDKEVLSTEVVDDRFDSDKVLLVESEKKEQKQGSTYNLLDGVVIDKDFTKKELLDAAKKRGLTGILEVISSQDPSYVKGGNIYTLAKNAGIDLFDENVELERGNIDEKYVGNGINDILTLEDFDKLYDVLKNTKSESDLSSDYAEDLPRKDAVSDGESIDAYVGDFGSIKQGEKEKSVAFPVAWPAILNKRRLLADDYENIAKTYKSFKNKHSALNSIAAMYGISKIDASDAVLESKNYAGVDNIKYSATLKNSFSKGDAAEFLDAYINNSVESVKENFKEKNDVDVSTNFYQAVDDFSKKLGLKKIRKSKLKDSEKKSLSDKIKKYI